MKYDLHFDAPLDPVALTAAVATALGVSPDEVVVVDPKRLPDRPALVYCMLRRGEVTSRLEIYSHAKGTAPAEKALAEALRRELGLASPSAGEGRGPAGSAPESVEVEVEAAAPGAPGFRSLVFEEGSAERAALEAPLLGYRRGVWVELEDGSRHPVTFYDLARLGRELDEAARAGRPFVAGPGLIVLSKVTLENMVAAAKTLVEEGFFER